MINYHAFFNQQLQALKTEGRYRTFANLERQVGCAPYALWHKPNGETKSVVVWCSNDYLSMSHHPDVIQAFQDAATLYGVGSGGTRNISGTARLHVKLEQTLADLHDKESALVFTSGYTANEASLSALGEGLPDCVFFSDEKNHASMIQGIRHSRAEKFVFRHNDMDDLRQKLASVDPRRPKVIAFVSLYSMDGDIAPLKQICDLAKEFNALTYLDEVHAVGIYGPKGNGLAAEQGLLDRVDIIQGNFAKAYGVVGGYITGSKALVDFVRSHASGFIFTTSLPPAIAAAALKSIEVLKADPSYRQRLRQNADYLKNALRKTQLNFIDSPSHIVPVVVGDAHLCQEVATRLLNDFQIYAQPINYPTVPKGQERLRLTVTPAHTKEMIDQLVEALDIIETQENSKQAA